MSHQAKETCDSLTTLLQRTRSHLDSVARHVEAELAANTGTGVNLLALVRRARRLERDFATIVEEHEAVLTAKKELASAAMGTMAGNWSALVDLRVRSGLRCCDETDEDLDALQAKLEAEDSGEQDG